MVLEQTSNETTFPQFEDGALYIYEWDYMMWVAVIAGSGLSDLEGPFQYYGAHLGSLSHTVCHIWA